MAENVHDEDMLIYMLSFYPIITDFMFPLKVFLNSIINATIR